MPSERYLRHQMISWFDQKMVSSARVGVIGAGAVGNEVVKNLTLLGVGEIDIYDFDSIEAHNLTKSVLFRESDIGQLKARVTANRARELDGAVQTQAYNGDFWNTLTIQRLRTYNALVCCADSFDARIKLNRLCYLLGICFINTGIDSQYASCQYYPFQSRKNLACYECGLDDAAYVQIQERNSCSRLGPSAVKAQLVPTTIVTSSFAGSIAASWALASAREKQALPSEVITVMMDTITGRGNRLTQRKRSECGGCGDVVSEVEVVESCGDFSRDLSKLEVSHDLTRTITMSDMIFAGYTLFQGNQGSEKITAFERADKVDPNFHKTIAEQFDRIELDVRDSFSFNEIVTQYKGLPLPAKYALGNFDGRWIMITHVGEGRRVALISDSERKG